jgi:hypothetical protein
MYLNVKKFQGSKPILYGLNTMSAPYGVSLKAADVLMDSDNRRALIEGMFLADVDGTVRLLPRTRVQTTTVSGASTMTIKTPTSQFKVGDVLYLYGTARVGFDGAIASGDRVTLSLGNFDYTVTAAGGTTLANLGALFVSTHASALLAQQGAVIYPSAVGSSMVIVAKDNYSLSVSATGNGTSTAASALTITAPTRLGRNALPIGTVQSIGDESPTKTRVITFTSAIPNVITDVVLADSIVGTRVSKLLGIYPDVIDLTEETLKHIAPIISADGVYKRNLPYIDEAIVAEMPNLRINDFFYK